MNKTKKKNQKTALIRKSLFFLSRGSYKCVFERDAVALFTQRCFFTAEMDRHHQVAEMDFHEKKKKK